MDASWATNWVDKPAHQPIPTVRYRLRIQWVDHHANNKFENPRRSVFAIVAAACAHLLVFVGPVALDVCGFLFRFSCRVQLFDYAAAGRSENRHFQHHGNIQSNAKFQSPIWRRRNRVVVVSGPSGRQSQRRPEYAADYGRCQATAQRLHGHRQDKVGT